MVEFPDIRIRLHDCFCVGDDEPGFKCAMPDVLTGTHLGRSARQEGGVARENQLHPFFHGGDAVRRVVVRQGVRVHDEWIIGRDGAPERKPLPVNEPIMRLDGGRSTDLGAGSVVRVGSFSGYGVGRPRRR